MSLDVSLDFHSVTINGKREFIWSGAFHYYRLPSRELWPVRLKTLKQAGFNAVDIYYAWNYHTEQEGVYDFTDYKDIDYLHKCIEDAGLYLIARPGPYICAEIDAGGFPGWLLAKKDILLRCRKLSGEIIMDEQYMNYVGEWFGHIIPKIAACNNLLLFQVENEFMTLPHLQGVLGKAVHAIRKHDPTSLLRLHGSDAFKFINYKLLPALGKLGKSGSDIKGLHTPNPYIAELSRMIREHGITVPLFHNDVQSTSDRVPEVDLAAIDDYPMNMYSDNWRGKTLIFSSTDVIEDGHDIAEKDRPIFIAEFQASWFDMWSGRGYDHLDRIYGYDQVDIITKTALSQRATLINYFMFLGGTTWGYLGSPDVYTSYYDAAPVAESGLPTQRYGALKWLAAKMARHCPDFLQTNLDKSIKSNCAEVHCRARKSASGKRYVFLRNLTLKPQNARINISSENFALDPVSMIIAIFDENGKHIETIGAYKGEENYIPEKNKPLTPPLIDWTISWGSPQLAPDYDDSSWSILADGDSMEMDALGHYYGFVWFRGAYDGKIKSISIDARNCFSIYVNSKLVASRDNFHNITGAGDDFAETYKIDIPAAVQTDERNVMVIVVESMGHNKDFECDARNPRGIISFSSGETKIDWRWRGGMLPGETGLCPVLPASAFKSAKKKSPVILPHIWNQNEEGVGLYETTFDLDGKFDTAKHPIGLIVPEAFSKANIYLNGFLIGRYWHEMGPQHKFYLPFGVLKEKGKNHLAIAVWKRLSRGGLGAVRLETY